MVRQFGGKGLPEDLDSLTAELNGTVPTTSSINLEGLPYFWAGATAISYIMYFGIGGFLHVSFTLIFLMSYLKGMLNKKSSLVYYYC